MIPILTPLSVLLPSTNRANVSVPQLLENRVGPIFLHYSRVTKTVDIIVPHLTAITVPHLAAPTGIRRYRSTRGEKRNLRKRGKKRKTAGGGGENRRTKKKRRKRRKRKREKRRERRNRRRRRKKKEINEKNKT